MNMQEGRSLRSISILPGLAEVLKGPNLNLGAELPNLGAHLNAFRVPSPLEHLHFK